MCSSTTTKPSLGRETLPSLASRFNDIVPTVENLFFGKSRVYITTNELKESCSIEFLRKIETVGNLFIGTSGFTTLNLASVREGVEYIVLIDPSKLTKLFWENMSTLICHSPNRKNCLENIQEHIKQSIYVYCPSCWSIADHYCQALSQPPSWLLDDIRFNKIQGIFKKKRFFFLQADLVDTAVCQSLRKIFKDFSLQVDTIYLSNIHNCIAAKNYLDYEKSLECLLSERTIIVDTTVQSYRITQELSKKFSKPPFLLINCIMIPRVHKKVENESCRAEQRVRQRNGESIETLYPITALAKQFSSEELFYQYGIYEKFYTEEEMKAVSVEVHARLTTAVRGGQTLNKELIEKVSADVLYPQI